MYLNEDHLFLVYKIAIALEKEKHHSCPDTPIVHVSNTVCLSLHRNNEEKKRESEQRTARRKNE